MEARMSRPITRRFALTTGAAFAAAPLLASPARITRIPDPTGYRITRWAQDPLALGSP